MKNNVYMIFILPGLVNFLRSVYGDETLDLTLLVVAAVSCIYGSSMRVTWKKLKNKKEHKPVMYRIEVIAIYVFGIGFGFASYFVGQQHPLWIAMLVGGIGSFLSIDILTYLVYNVPKILDGLLKMYLNNKGNDKP